MAEQITYVRFTKNLRNIVLDLKKIYGNKNLSLKVGTKTWEKNRDKKILSTFRINGVNAFKADTILPILFKFPNEGISILSLEDFDFSKNYEFDINVFEDKLIGKINCFVDNEENNLYKFFNNVSMPIASNMQSFMLLRTNPKLTGNIKLVVTEDNNLYLDTFKVSSTSILNERKYRHFPISNTGNYAYDVYNAFHTVSNSQLYDVYTDSYESNKNKYDLNELIENIYEYGAEFNNDSLYSENMKILAPLYIGKTLPTYFMIFRTDKLYNEDENTTSIDRFNELLTNAEIVKIFDLRNQTNIGKYLNNYKTLVNKYLNGVCNLQFIELEDPTSLRSGKNTWRGISYTKGIFVDIPETSYFATLILKSGVRQQEEYDMFLVNGFSRNNLLYPNIINLEFMFNDKKTNDFIFKNYFGLYLTENAFQTYKEITQSKYNERYVAGVGNFTKYNGVIGEFTKVYNSTISYYDNDNTLMKQPLSIVETTIKNFPNRLFAISTLNNVLCVRNIDTVKDFIRLHVINYPYQNLANLKSNKVFFETNQKSFMTLHLNQLVSVGEHIRIIIPESNKDNLDHNIVYDIIATDDERLKNVKNYISPYILTNFGTKAYSNDNKTEIYRLNFYAKDINDKTQLADLQEQITRIIACIYKFNENIGILSISKNSVSIYSQYEKTYIQHILSQLFDERIPIIEDYVLYCTKNNITYAYRLDLKTDLYNSKHLMFSLSGIELLGNRYSSLVKFISTSLVKQKYVYEIDKDLYQELQNTMHPLIAVNNSLSYMPIEKFKLEEYELKVTNGKLNSSKMVLNSEEYNTVTSPFNNQKSIIISPYPIRKINDNLNICNSSPCNVSLLGINSIKDINMYIDLLKTYTHTTLDYIDIKAGEIIPIDGSDPRIHPFITYKVVTGSIGKYIPLNSQFFINGEIVYVLKSKKSTISRFKTTYLTFENDVRLQLCDTELDKYNYNVEEPILFSSNFYKDYKELRYSFIPETIAQWKSNGTYFDNAAILNIDNLINKYQIVGNFNENLYTPASYDNKHYICNKLDDEIKFKTEKTTFKNIILKHKYPISIKKFLITNFKIDSAIGTYNPNIQTLEFIYFGIKFIIKLSNAKFLNEIRLEEFNNYEIFILNDYNLNNNEIFISKEEEFIFIVNHKYKVNNIFTNESVKTINNRINNALYDWFESTYNYNLINTTFLKGQYYIQKSNNYIISDNFNYMIEVDVPSSSNFIQSELPVCAYFSTASQNSYIATEQYDVVNTLYSNNTGTTGTLGNIVEFGNNFENIMNKYYVGGEFRSFDFRSKKTYAIFETGDEETVTYQEKLQAYIKSFDNDIDLYIIDSDGENKTFNINDSYKPLTLTLEIPNNIKYNQGYFDIDYKDIFEFEQFDEISNDINLDTLYANTKIKNINDIPNYYQFKIMNNNCTCSNNIFSISKKNICATDWDNNVYRLYNDDSKYALQSGYLAGITDKMFFGSKCLNMSKQNITLENWNLSQNNKHSITTSKNNEKAKAVKKYNIIINLTDTFINYFLNNNNFKNNWNFLEENVSNQAMNNYINKTVLRYYNLNEPVVELYKRYNIKSIGSSNAFIKLRPINFSEFELVSTDFKTSLSTNNNQIYITITVDYNNHNAFYPIIKINKF